MSSNPRRIAAILAAVVALIVALTACASDDGPKDTDHPVVVTSTTVWASVARAVGGEHAEVTALQPVGLEDPHDWEPSMSDTAKVQDANVIVMNGGHYDAALESAAADAKGRKVVATDVHGGIAHDDHEGHDHEGDDHEGDGHEADGHESEAHDHEADGHEGHDHSGPNEHVFYDLVTVGDTADAIADALAEVAPAHADYYRANAATFNEGIDALLARLHELRDQHAGDKVIVTEPVAQYMLAEIGLVDVTPEGLPIAIEDGQSPTAADRAAVDDLLGSGQIALVVYNEQRVDGATTALLDTARADNVPVVTLRESLPEGQDDFLAWQNEQVDALTRGLAS